MAKTNQAGNFLTMDPAVMAALQGGERRQADRALPRNERAKVAKKRSLQAERNGRRGVYDLEPDLIELIKTLAETYGTTASGVAEMMLRWAALGIERGELELGDYQRRLERNPRYEYEMVWVEPEAKNV
jgi:hypothetical protein